MNDFGRIQKYLGNIWLKARIRQFILTLLRAKEYNKSKSALRAALS
ncbi:MAG: hypothetical protein J6M47_00280 [Clostridia bacterium]|nr:hypothetical protein [Clostridia bacterium]